MSNDKKWKLIYIIDNIKWAIIIICILIFIYKLCEKTYYAYSYLQYNAIKEIERNPVINDEYDFNRPEQVFAVYGPGSNKENSKIRQYLRLSIDNNYNNSIRCKDGITYYYNKEDTHNIVSTGNQLRDIEKYKDEIRNAPYTTPEEVFNKYGFGSDTHKTSITVYLHNSSSDVYSEPVECLDGNTYYYSKDDWCNIIEQGNNLIKVEEQESKEECTVQEYSDQIGDLHKPVIYLYGYDNEEVNISLVLNDATLSCSYPEYNDGWKIKAQPDGHLIDEYGNKYKYLYWEAESNKQWDMSNGFCIKGENTAEFLEESLKTLGLNSDEINEFIIYWLPQMQNNKFNVIKFQDKEYIETAKINIDNKPDNMIRVFMTWYPSEEFVEIEQQELNANSIDRSGKTLVEWGGSKIEK